MLVNRCGRMLGALLGVLASSGFAATAATIAATAGGGPTVPPGQALRLPFSSVPFSGSGGSGSLTAAPAAAASSTTCPASPSYSWLPPTPGCWPLVTADSTTPDQEITAGVSHHTETIQTVGGRQYAQILNVDLTNPNVRVGMVEADNILVDPADETLTSMAGRTGAVAGINADFFNNAAQGDPVGMVVQNGQMLKSPNPDGHNADFLMLTDGQAVVTDETFTGTVSDGSASHSLVATNLFDPPVANSLTLDTPAEGAVSIPASTVAVGQLQSGTGQLEITQIEQNVTSLPALAAGEEDIVAGGSAESWLTTNIHPGDAVSTSETLAPYPLSQIATAVSGGGILEQNGQMAVPVEGGGENNEDDPVTALGIPADGRHLIIAVFDGHQPEDAAEGLTRPEEAQWMISHGAENAILFDSGGSSEMVGRLPGQTAVSVLNTPSDGEQRPVANGLFFYTNEPSPGAPASVHVDADAPLSTAAGIASAVPAYASDADGNPTSVDPVTVNAVPASLGTWSGGTFTAGRPGTGQLVVSAGGVSASEPLTVTPRFAALALSPDRADVDNGATQSLAVSGTNPGGAPVTVDPTAASWSVSNPALGTISSAGVFTATAQGTGVETVTATLDGRSASATLGVGTTPAAVFSADQASAWGTQLLNATATPSAGFTQSSDVPPGSSQTGSISLRYAFPDTPAVHQVAFFPNAAVPDVGQNSQGQTPTSVSFALKVDDPAPDNLSFWYAYTDGTGTARTVNTPVTSFNGWAEVTIPLPSGTVFPLTLDYLDLLNTHATAADSGSFTFAGMQANYGVNTATPTPYVAIDPNNPGWLSFSEDADQFGPGGTTFLAGGQSELSAEDPGSAAAVSLADMAHRVAGQGYVTAAGQSVSPLRPAARPGAVLNLGDASADGQSADLDFAHQAWSAFGLPLYSIPGAEDTSDGALPENVNWSQAFGQSTHFSLVDGPATLIGLDNSQGSIPLSDPDQTPAEAQYPWLAAQLDAVHTPVVLMAINRPAYDPSDDNDASQFSDRWDADQFLQLLEDYQQSHPAVHVVVLYGDSGGFSDQFLDPEGDEGVPSGGIAQLSFADVGSPPDKPADQGGFFHFGLVHVDPDGRVQFSVEPVLAVLKIDQGDTATLVPGRSSTLSATAVNVGGDDDADPPTVPVADPMSHRWTSSNPWVAWVDPDTGRVVGLAPGHTRITVSAGGLSASLRLTVTRLRRRW